MERVQLLQEGIRDCPCASERQAADQKTVDLRVIARQDQTRFQAEVLLLARLCWMRAFDPSSWTVVDHPVVGQEVAAKGQVVPESPTLSSRGRLKAGFRQCWAEALDFPGICFLLDSDLVVQMVAVEAAVLEKNSVVEVQIAQLVVAAGLGSLPIWRSSPDHQSLAVPVFVPWCTFYRS